MSDKMSHNLFSGYSNFLVFWWNIYLWKLSIEVNKKQYLCSFVAKNNSYTLDLEKFWAAGLLDGCKTFRYLISCVRCSIFQISIAPIDRMTWQLYSWNGKHDDHCKLRALMGGYWLKLWRHVSELAQRQGWWHLSDWMRLLWNWRKWQTSFTFKLRSHWLWSGKNCDVVWQDCRNITVTGAWQLANCWGFLLCHNL